MSGAASPSQMAVVAAAIVRDGRVLAARRSRPATLAGGWEFPGGKIESGESEPVALARECAEELGVQIRVGARIAVAADARIRLLLYRAELIAGEPAPRDDHDALRWLAPPELPALGWLPIDRELLEAVTAAILGA